MADTVGELDLREEQIDRIVRNFALKEFKLLPICTTVATSGWSNTYYQETDSDLTGGTGSAVAGVPRLANFPYGQVSWTETTEKILKYGMESVISWEDQHTSTIDVMARTLLRIARAVASAVDTAIITELNTTTNTTGAVATWDNAVIADRDPVQDILAAISAMQIDNWDPLKGNCVIVLHPTNHKELLMNQSVRNAGQFYTSKVTSEGMINTICGLRIIITTAQTENTVTLAIEKDAMTWYEAAALTTHTIVDPGVKTTIRAFQVGVPVLINNNAAFKITGC